MISYFAVYFDPNMSAPVSMTDAVVVDLNRIERLDQIGVFPVHVNHVSDVDLAVREFNNPDVYAWIVVNDPSDQRFSYPYRHDDLLSGNRIR
jgi:hypothetical protein